MAVVEIEKGIKLRPGMGIMSTGDGYTLLIPSLELDEISELRGEFIRLTDYNNEYECAEQLTEFLYKRLQYDDSEEPINKISLKESIRLEKGVCKEMAAVYQILAQGLNLDTRYVRGTYKGSKHAWIKLKIGGQILYADPTNEKFLPYKKAVKKFNLVEGVNKVMVPGKNKQQFIDQIT